MLLSKANESIVKSSFSSNKSEADWIDSDLSISAIVLCCCLIVIGISGNFITIAALLRCRKLHSSTTVLVINLSAADLFFCACVMPVRAATFAGKQTISCGVFLFFFYGNVTVSLMSMVAIAMNRYFLIRRTSFYQTLFRPFGTGIIVLCVWIYSFTLWSVPVSEAWGRFRVKEGTPFCELVDEEYSPKPFLALFGFVLPCVVITFAYSAVFLTIKRSCQRLSSHTAPFQPNQYQKDLIFTQMLMIAYCSFLVFFLPNFFILVIPPLSQSPIALTVGEILLWTSSCINPIVYVFRSRHYRKAYAELLHCYKTADRINISSGIQSPGQRNGKQDIPMSFFN